MAAAPSQHTARVQQLLGLGLSDAFRLFEQPPKSFSWWDYRQFAFRRNLGLRIDLTLVSDALRGACIGAGSGWKTSLRPAPPRNSVA